MAIKQGNSDVSAIYLGSTAVNKIYAGATEIYSAAPSIVTTGLIYNWDAANGDATGVTDSVNNVFADASAQTFSTADGNYYENPGSSTAGPVTAIIAPAGDVSLLNSLTAITFETWINIVNITTPGTQIFMEKRDASLNRGLITFYTNSALTIRVGATGFGGFTWTTALPENTWQHLSFTITNAGDTKIYKDGIEVASGTYAPTWSLLADASTTNLHLNGEDAGSNQPRSKMGVQRFYDKALTAAEVLQNYNAQKNRFQV